MLYTFEEETDEKTGKLLHVKLLVQQLVGKSPEKLASLTCYPSTNKIHIQGNFNNVLSYISNHLTQLMLITNTATDNDMEAIKCVECHTSKVATNIIIAPNSPPPHTATTHSQLFDCTGITTAHFTTSTPVANKSTIPTPTLHSNMPSPVAPLSNVSISKCRETTLINQVMTRVDRMEESAADKSVAESAKANRFAELQDVVRGLSDRLSVHETTSKQQRDLIDELSHKVSQYREQLWTTTKEAECGHQLLEEKLNLCYQELEDKSRCKCECTPTPRIIPVPAPQRHKQIPVTTTQPPTDPHHSFENTVQSHTETSPTASQIPSLMEQPSKCSFIGDSNLQRTLPFIKNRSVKVHTNATPGATFQSLSADVRNLQPCKILCVQGGTNDAAQRDNVSDAIPDLADLINVSKQKADRVILIPPPPTSEASIEMETLMQNTAKYHDIECIPIHPRFPLSKSGPHLINRDKLHCTKMGTGLYGLAIVNYLQQTSDVILQDITSCIKCHKSGHGYTHCSPQPPHSQHRHGAQPQAPMFPPPGRYRATPPPPGRYGPPPGTWIQVPPYGFPPPPPHRW